jgi:hypothetical protein
VFEKIFVESWSKSEIEKGKMAVCAETCSSNSWFYLLYMKNKEKLNG